MREWWRPPAGMFSRRRPAMCQPPGPAARPPTVAGTDPAPVKAVVSPTGGTHSGASRLPSLSGLRFAASCAVVYAHCMLLIEPRLARTPGPEVWLGGSAVSLFFMLSGFVLTHAARPGDSTAAFWWRRAAKVFPNHVFTWCLAVAALAGTGALAPSVPAIAAELSSLFLVQTWVPSQRFVSAGNPVSWTLAAEVFFYLLFPVLLRWVRRLSGRGLVVGAATAVAVCWALPVFCEVVVNPGRSFFMDYWFLYMLPISRLPEFVLGMLAARISGMGIRLPRSGVLLAASSVISTIVVSSSYLPQPFMFVAATVVPLVVLVHATAELDLRGKPSLLRWRPVVFLGEMSYAVYLVHLMVLGVAYVSLTSRGWSALQAVLAALPVALLASYLLYVRVERPCMRRLLALGGRAARRTEPVDSNKPGGSDTSHGPMPETAEDGSRADAGHRRRGERTAHRTRANDEPPDATPQRPAERDLPG
ncbi:acyltransferase family protein [Streptomyces sp. NPDC054933]